MNDTPPELPAGQCCGKCYYHRPSADFGGRPVCRKNPPRVAVIPVQQVTVKGHGASAPTLTYQSYFAPMAAEDWGCGEFKPRESLVTGD